MHLVRNIILSLLMASPIGFALHAQSSPAEPPSTEPAQTYKLTFTVTQLVKGKEDGRRSYSALFTPRGNNPGSIRVQNRVPVSTGTGAGTQFTYHEIGVDIDFSAAQPEVAKGLGPRQLPLSVAANITAMAPGKPPGLDAPTIRDDRWKSTLVVALDKPTMLFISDDPYTDLSTRIDLTATLVSAQ
jgi:hypothetical protein